MTGLDLRSEMVYFRVRGHRNLCPEADRHKPLPLLDLRLFPVT